MQKGHVYYSQIFTKQLLTACSYEKYVSLLIAITFMVLQK